MSKNLSILIYYSESRLAEQLIRLIRQTFDQTDNQPEIRKCSIYKGATESLQKNKSINIFISDLFFFDDRGSRWNEVKYIPEEIKLAQLAKEINPNIFTIIINTSLQTANINNKIPNFIDDKVIDSYLSTTTTPYKKKFTDSLISQLKLVHESLKTSNKLSPSQLWKSKNYVSSSYWIFICDLLDNNHRDLINNFLLWEKKFPVKDTSILVREIDDEECSTLVDNEIINKNIELPSLLVGESHNMNPSIKIGSRTLTRLLSTNNLDKFIYSIHYRLRHISICDIKKQIISQEYWNQFKIDDIISFSPETGEFVLVDDLKYQSRTNSPKLELHHSIQYYDGKEEQIIEELKKENLEPGRWEKMIDILALSDKDIAKKFLKDFLFDYSHDYWKPSLDFDLVSLQANKIIASLIEPDKLEEDRDKTILFLRKILTSGTEEAKLGCVRFITSFSDYLIDLRLFQPLLDLWGVYRNKNSKYVNLIKMALRYFIDSIEKLEDTNSEYKINFKPGIN